MHVGHTQFVLQQLSRTARPSGEVGDGELLDAFILRRDEAAFAALLRRHGPMVWGVCRRLAGQQPDAEDAFQAVFLILVRKASCVRPRERVGAWLHGVAFRTARKARRLAERRRAREKQVEQVPDRAVDATLPDADLVRVIDEELRRLPERLRLPVLLCDVEGRPQREVARELSVPVGTLGHRLDSARRILARRLTRRGVTLSLAGLAAAGVPGSLSAVTRRAATGLAAGRELASLVPPQIVALTEGALTMTRSKFRLAGALLLVALVGGLGLNERLRPTLIAGENEPAKATPAAKPAEPPIDDATFLRRISLDLRGVVPTFIEMNYFLADKDPAKRRKVVGWMIEPAGEKKAANAATEQTERLTLYWKALQDAQQAQDQPQSYSATRLALLALGEAGAEPPKPAEPKNEPAPAAKDVETLVQELLREAAKPANTPQNAERRKALLQRVHDLIQQPAPPESEDKQRLRQQIDRGIEFLARQQAKEESDALRQLLSRYQASRELANKLPKHDPKDPESAAENLSRAILRLHLLDADTGNDTEFFRRLMLDLIGIPPTAVEMNYFLADKDSNKRQKVTEWLLKNPEAAKNYKRWTTTLTNVATAGGDRFDQLLTELLSGSRGDEQILDSLMLATLARFPTNVERVTFKALRAAEKDRRAGWRTVLEILTKTDEFRQHATALQSRAK